MNKLKQWRIKNDLTTTEAGGLIGVTRQSWSRFETGLRQVSSKKVLVVERITKISRHDLRPDIFGKKPGASSEPPTQLEDLAS